MTYGSLQSQFCDWLILVPGDGTLQITSKPITNIRKLVLSLHYSLHSLGVVIDLYNALLHSLISPPPPWDFVWLTYRPCLKKQDIDLLAEGYTQEKLDLQPTITVEDWWVVVVCVEAYIHVVQLLSDIYGLNPNFVGTAEGLTVAAPITSLCVYWTRTRKCCRSSSPTQWPLTLTRMTNVHGNRYRAGAGDMIRCTHSNLAYLNPLLGFVLTVIEYMNYTTHKIYKLL